MQYKFDLHVHTNHSNDGVSSLEKLIVAAKKRGLTGFAVTDHNLCTKLPDLKEKDFLLIPGCEISTQVGHIVALFIHKDISEDILHKEGLPSLEEAVEEIHKCGGIAIWAHPYQKSGKAYSAEQIQLVDMIETVNARATFKNKEANHQAEQLAKMYDYPQSGGSDAHSDKEIGNAYTIINASELTLEAIKQSLLCEVCEPKLIHATPHIRKGISQFYKATRTKKPLRILKSIVYMGYCFLLDCKK